MHRERFALVDGLRGLAALAVVLYHAGAGGHLAGTMASLPPVRILGCGHLGVAVFFVLSGFVVAHSLHRTRMTWAALEAFTLRRALRLDPPYWVAILLCLAAAGVNGGWPSQPTLAVLLAHLVYLQDLLGLPPISGVFWTLCLELQFYLGYAALLLAGGNRPGQPLQGRRTAVLLAAAAVASLPWPLGIGLSVPHGLFPPHWHGFLLGVASYWAWKEPGCRPFVAAWGGLLVLGAWRTGSDFTAVCSATALLLHAAARAERLTALDRRWLQGIGTVSYSLYLCHNPITGAVFRLGFGLTGRTLATEILWLGMALVACLGGAAALWWLVERPSQILSRRIGKPGRPRIGAAPAAGAPRLSA